MKRTAEGSRWATWRRQAIGVTGVLLAVGLVLAPAGASAQRRVALVIGNAAYVEPDAGLTNPVNDARDVAQALGALDFDEVFLREDLDREGMEQAVDDFIGTLRAGDVAVFYYAGHGLELDDGENYLAPVDFSSSYTPVRARNRALQANEVQALMEEAGARTRIVILDACRNNPFERVRSLTRGGLGQMTPRGGLVAYATEAGDTAADNGLYAQHLVAALRVPGLPAMELFTRVSEAVEAASDGAQVPIQQFGSAVGRFVFHPGDVVDPVPDPPIVPDPGVDVTRLDVAQLRPMAERGDARAQNQLGFMYETGRGVEQDYDEAVRWYRRSAEQGHALGQSNLGFMYRAGRGVEQDDEEAVRWYRRSAEQGHARGQSNLGFMYRAGRGVEQDDEEAVRWYRRSAEQGHAVGQSNLGFMYRAGRGVEQDDEEAVRWYRRSAEQGHAVGQSNLGFMYRAGRGVEQDDEEAVRWYRRSAEQGHARGQSNLGFMYETGRGVEQDYDEAARWYRRAAEKGHEYAQRALDRLVPSAPRR